MADGDEVAVIKQSVARLSDMVGLIATRCWSVVGTDDVLLVQAACEKVRLAMGDPDV